MRMLIFRILLSLCITTSSACIFLIWPSSFWNKKMNFGYIFEQGLHSKSSKGVWSFSDVRYLQQDFDQRVCTYEASSWFFPYAFLRYYYFLYRSFYLFDLRIFKLERTIWNNFHMEFKLYERYCRIPIKILTILAQNTL